MAALGLVTNATSRLEDDLARLGLTDAFDFVVNSSAVGCAKPSRCFYEQAARRCGCERGAVLFVDDQAENVDGAIDFGFHGHLHRDPVTLERLLREWEVIREGSDRARLPVGQGRRSAPSSGSTSNALRAHASIA